MLSDPEILSRLTAPPFPAVTCALVTAAAPQDLEKKMGESTTFNTAGAKSIAKFGHGAAVEEPERHFAAVQDIGAAASVRAGPRHERVLHYSLVPLPAADIVFNRFKQTVHF